MSKILHVSLSAPEEHVLAAAGRVILNGGVIVYPTETLYGIGANALSSEAVAKVGLAKRRKDNKPILVIVDSTDMLKHLVEDIPESAYRLMHAFWPGPLTIVFNAAKGIPGELMQGTGTIGVRIPSSEFCLELLRRCACPLTSTSANISGEPVHRSVDEIRQGVHQGIDLYLDAGVLPETKPSTVVSLAAATPTFIREGVISFDAIRHVLPTLGR